MTILDASTGTSEGAEPLERLLLRAAACLDGDRLFAEAVTGLVEEFGAAFARIWVVGPGDRCESCGMVPLCADRSSCLHLAASAGISTSLDGEYARVPFTNLKIGEIAARREAHWTNAVLQDPRVAHKDWARESDLKCFAGYPLVAGDRLHGVLAVFGRDRLPAETFRRLGVYAQLLGIARRNAERLAEGGPASPEEGSPPQGVKR